MKEQTDGNCKTIIKNEQCLDKGVQGPLFIIYLIMKTRIDRNAKQNKYIF